MIHVNKHDMDPNSNINYRRKIAPLTLYNDMSADFIFHSYYTQYVTMKKGCGQVKS